MKLEENRIFYGVIPLSIVAIVYACSAASTVVLWVLCAFFLFALIDPWMQKFTGKGINPILLSIALVLIGFGLATGLGFLVYKTSYGIITQVFSYKSAIYKFYQSSKDYVAHFTQLFSHPHDPALTGNAGAGAVAGNAAAANASGGAGATNSVSPDQVGLGVLSGLNSVLSILSFTLLTPLLTFFMLAERDHFSAISQHAFADPADGKKVWKKITDAINGYFLGNFILILVSFPIFVLTFCLLGVKAFLSLGLLSAILNLVPFLGFVLAATLPTLDLVMNQGNAGGVVILISVCCFTHFSIANVVTPKILGAKLNLNATASTIALIAYGELWGPLGLLLAIPTTALIKIMLEHSSVVPFQTFAALMNEDHVATGKLRMKKKAKTV
jgi:predicted PurR-regulated permease PerM